MRLLRWLLLALGACLLQSVVAPRYLPGPFRPELLLLMAAFVAMRGPDDEALPVCWLLGLLRDVLSCGPLGAYALMYLLIGLLLPRLRASLNPRSLVTHGLLGFAACLVVETLYLVADSVRLGIAPPAAAAGALFITSLATGCLTPISFHVLERMRPWLGLRKPYTFGAR